MTSGDRCSFNWESLVPHSVHPVRVAIIEAMEWINEPLAPKELDQIFDEEFGLSLVAYHTRKLADVGAVEKIRQRPVRGALQSFYVLSTNKPTSSSLFCE